MATAFYKDLSLDFIPHPVSGDIRPVTNETAIKRALKNLIFTEKGTKPFFPQYGSDVSRYLFSNADSFNRYDLEQSLFKTINEFEPRVRVILIDVQFEANEMKIKVDYEIKSTRTPGTITTTITRTA
jgi:phage baseplate assembly protein W